MTLTSAKNVVPSNLSIPTIPAVVQRINQMLQDPEAGVREIALVVAEDAPLAAKVLKIANSAYYGLREKCMSTQHAAAILGVRVLKNVVTQASVMNQYAGMDDGGIDLDGLWRHSVLAAQSCQYLAKRCRGKLGITPDEFYVCGLLHDLGKIVLLDSLKAKYVAVVQQSEAQNLPLHVLEQQALGFDHTDVGFTIATRWGLPDAIAHAIQYHHGPEDQILADPIVALVARTNLVIHWVCAANPVAASSSFDNATMESLGLTGQDVNDLLEFVDRSRFAIEI
jgi:putative nucleotidyltransferase with HDIG domain